MTQITVMEAMNLMTEMSSRIRSDPNEYASFLRSLGRHCKRTAEQILAIHSQNPEAIAVADARFWNATMLRSTEDAERVLVMPDGSELHDAADTTGEREPYIWQLRARHMETVKNALANEYGTEYNTVRQTIEAVCGGNKAAEYAIWTRLGDPKAEQYLPVEPPKDDAELEAVRFITAAVLRVIERVVFTLDKPIDGKFKPSPDAGLTINYNTGGHDDDDNSRTAEPGVSGTLATADAGAGAEQRDNGGIEGARPDGVDGQNEYVPRSGGGNPELERLIRDSGSRNQEAGAETFLPPASVPDFSVTHEELAEFGYTEPDMLPLSRERAMELFLAGYEIYLLFSDGADIPVYDSREDVSDMVDVIHSHEGLFGITEAEWAFRQRIPPVPLDEYNSTEQEAEAETPLPPDVEPLTPITDAEVDTFLARYGSSFAEGKYRILSYFLTNAKTADRASFLKHEYGEGGGTWTEGRGWHNHGTVGITLKRGSILDPAYTFKLTWSQAAERIDTLITSGRYMTRSELDFIPDYEKLRIGRAVVNAWSAFSPEPSPLPNANLTYPDAEDWAELNAFLDDKERVTATLETLLTAFQTMPHSDRYFKSVMTAMEYVNSWGLGVFTLFPNLDKLPAPENAIMPLPTAEQMSMFDSENAPVNDKLALADAANRLKRDSGGAIVAWQLGSFYELYDEDAAVASEVLGITVIDDGTIRFTGIPMNSLSQNITALTAAGYDVTVSATADDGIGRTVTRYAAIPLTPDPGALTTEEAEDAPQPLYKVGDTVWLDDVAYRITRISDITGDVQLLDPELTYPIYRSESAEVFEWLLTMDERNEAFVEPVTFFAPDAEAEFSEYIAELGDGFGDLDLVLTAASSNKDRINAYFSEKPRTMQEAAQFLHDIYGETYTKAPEPLTLYGITDWSSGFVGLTIHYDDSTDAVYSWEFAALAAERLVEHGDYMKTPEQLERGEAPELPTEKAFTLAEAHPVGDTVLIPTVFNDSGNFEHTEKRIRVRIEEPVGKYPVYSRLTAGASEPYYYLPTESGRLIAIYRAGTYHGHGDERNTLTEESIDRFYRYAYENVERTLQDPDAWVDFAEAAVANRLAEAEAHNAPIREQREAESRQRREEDEARGAAEMREREAAFEIRVAEMAANLVNYEYVDCSKGSDDERHPMLALFARYGVELPLATKGWVARNLNAVHFKEDGYCSFWLPQGVKVSETFHDRLKQLRDTIKAESWKSISAALEEDTEERIEPAQKAEPPAPRVGTAENRNYNSFERMFPQIVSGEYQYMRLKASAFEPLSVERLGGNRVSIMHTFDINGDLCYDPDMVFELDTEAKTLTPLSFEQSIPPEYQVINDDGIGVSYDGNGRELRIPNLLKQLNSFTSQWFANIAEQDFTPVRAIKEIDGADVTVTFSLDGTAILDIPERDASGNIPVYTIGVDDYADTRSQPEKGETTENRFEIYQIRENIDEARNFRFAPLNELDALGLTPDRENYELVYSAPLIVTDTENELEMIYGLFQHDSPECPPDYTARSVSVSDVIVLQREGKTSAHYVNNASFRELPEFLRERRQPEKEYELGYGFLGNGLSVWNRLEERGGDYTQLAHIAPDRSISWREDNLPEEVRARIEEIARTDDSSVSVTQPERKVFDSPPEGTTRITDFEVVAKRALERVMADNAYIQDLNTASQRASLRNPVGWVLEQNIRDHKADEPKVFNAWFTDFDFQKRLLDYALAESRKRREQSAAAPRAGDSGNYHIPAQPDPPRSPRERYQDNIAAIRLLKALDEENRSASPDEQAVLAKYVGWGGLSQAFGDGSATAWQRESVELRDLLTQSEYEAARASTLTAYYTPPEVIREIYYALEARGVKPAAILEPSCGIGSFFGLLPESWSSASLHGVELDNITARIAKQLYPGANIRANGFESVPFADNSVDLVIGNVPFGDFGVSDRRYDERNFLIHDYFFAKSLDAVRPGGVIAFITSSGTMDKQRGSVRRYIAERAELLGAVRLPNNTFKAEAGTEAVSDIIFLQKRERPIVFAEEPSWLFLDTMPEGFTLNSYYTEHPEMVLGTLKTVSGRYGEELTVEPIPGAKLGEQLRMALTALPPIEQSMQLVPLPPDAGILTAPADPSVRNYSFTLSGGQLHYRNGDAMEPVSMNKTAEARTIAMLPLRDKLRELISVQTLDVDDANLRAMQGDLMAEYDKFRRVHGLINSRANELAFGADSSYYLMCSLEILNEDGGLKKLADVFTKRTIRKRERITFAETSQDALAASLDERGFVDLAYMSQLTQKTEEVLLDELRGDVFIDPESSVYVTADEYLSGNVRKKLEIAGASALTAPELDINVRALEAVQPEDLSPADIDVRLGSIWVDSADYKQFIVDTLHPSPYYERIISVGYSQYLGEWTIEGKRADQFNVLATTTYGTEAVSAYKLIEDALNLRATRVYMTVPGPNGEEKRVVDRIATALAQQKQEQLKDAFVNWFWKDPERRDRYVKLYNDRFNSYRPREYDGSKLTLPGSSPELKLEKHQLDAVARQKFGGNTLLAHVVGAGKTYEIVAGTMEAKRLGRCTKAMIVVPNNVVRQWTNAWYELYPGAELLVATEKDFEPKNRKKFVARIATGDYDAVIIAQSQFEKIPISLERQEALLREEIREIAVGIAEAKAKSGERATIKQLERAKKKAEKKLTQLLDRSRKDEDNLTFEELGIDRLCVDESDFYKNLYTPTKMRNVAGLGQTEAQKASDLYAKCRYIDEVSNNKGLVFATGTPISNTMVEMYTNMRYLQQGMLEELGINSFDAWASTFAEPVTALEIKPEGSGYQMKTRLRFFNIPELMQSFRECADIKTSDMLDLQVPEAEHHVEKTQASEFQKEIIKTLAERAERIRRGGVDAGEDNMLLITGDGRKLALDQRIINPGLPDSADSKVNQCVDRVFGHWLDGAEQRLTQLVFCDLSTPKKGEFSIYEDIRTKLMERGVPANEIAFIHDYDTSVKKEALFARVRAGAVRVVLGSRAKLGAGVNVQDRLIAIHQLDPPWRPRDLEQSNGRGLRRGNTNPVVHIHTYITEGTFDSYSFQLLEQKQRNITQIMTSKTPVRRIDDVDESVLSYAEIKALASGNPKIAERENLMVEIQRLKMLEGAHRQQHWELEMQISSHLLGAIRRTESAIRQIEHDITKLATMESSDFAMTVDGKEYTERTQAGYALMALTKGALSPQPVTVGEYRSLRIEQYYDSFGSEWKIRLLGAGVYSVTLGDSAVGNVERIENTVKRMPATLASLQESLRSYETQLDTAKQEINAVFPKAAELADKQSRLRELDAELKIGETGLENIIAESVAVPENDEPQCDTKILGRDEYDRE